MLTICGAIEARRMIEAAYHMVINHLLVSVEDGNQTRQQYWLERLPHLAKQRRWIDEEILKLEAAADETSKPPMA